MQIRYKVENNQESLQLVLDGIKKDTFQDRRFYLLEKPNNKFKDRVLLVPKGFIENPTIINNSNLLENLSTPYNKTINEFLESTQKKLSAYKEILQTEFPIEEINDIQIKPVIWGTLGSISDNLNTIYPRIDRNVNQVFQLIINTLIDKDYLAKQTNANYSDSPKLWKDKQLKTHCLTQKLLNKTSFQSQQKTNSLINILQNNSKGNLVKQSAENYAKLGYPIKPLLDLKKLRPHLTKKEILILKELQNNNLEIVTFDRISEILWRDKATEKYSLYAITKRIQRLRDKLKQNGVTENIIHTQRGVGYILFD